MKALRYRLHPMAWIVGASALVLFATSSLRHFLFQSNALDLGWFDQAAYLISRGYEPIISFRGFHILGDHAAFIVYLLALPYRIYPDVHWLLAIQALALALGALPVWQLARQAGLGDRLAIALAVAYLLYPLTFNANLFDFHPEVIAVPALLWAVLAARGGNLWGFCLAIAVALSCKAVLSLTVAAMGLWLGVWEKKWLWGGIALVAGVAWFAITTEAIIPYFSGQPAAAVSRYAFLGDSVPSILKNLLLNPVLVLGRLFSAANLVYLLLLGLPLLWGLSPRHLAPLVAAIPALALNLLTDHLPQKDLVHQYSLPILPFLVIAAIDSLAAGRGWLRSGRGIVLWSLVAFLALGKAGYFGSKYLESLDTWRAMREAVALVPAGGSLLTSPQMAPHLTHRPEVQLAIAGGDLPDLHQFDYILLNRRHPGWENSQELVANLAARLQATPQFQLRYQRDGVDLFERRPEGRGNSTANQPKQ